MTRCAFTLLVLIFPLALCAEDKKPTVFASKDGKFSVTLPEKPSEKTKDVTTGAGPQVAHMFIVDQKDRTYFIMYTVYSPKALGDNTEKLFGSVIEGYAKVLKGKVLSDEKITLGKGKHPGHEVRIEMPDKKGLYRARIYLVGDRLYQVVALGPDDFAKSKAVDDYLKSFTIEE